MERVATSFSIEIVEIHDDSDIKALLTRIPPTREPVLARLAAELDDSTDAIILQRQNRADWEMPFLAVINCRGWPVRGGTSASGMRSSIFCSTASSCGSPSGGESGLSTADNGPVDRVDGQESLEIWQTSDGGPIGQRRLGIEALRRRDAVWCLVHPHFGALGTRTFRARDQVRHGTRSA